MVSSKAQVLGDGNRSWKRWSSLITKRFWSQKLSTSRKLQTPMEKQWSLPFMRFIQTWWQCKPSRRLKIWSLLKWKAKGDEGQVDPEDLKGEEDLVMETDGDPVSSQNLKGEEELVMEADGAVEEAEMNGMEKAVDEPVSKSLNSEGQEPLHLTCEEETMEDMQCSNAAADFKSSSSSSSDETSSSESSGDDEFESMFFSRVAHLQKAVCGNSEKLSSKVFQSDEDCDKFLKAERKSVESDDCDTYPSESVKKSLDDAWESEGHEAEKKKKKVCKENSFQTGVRSSDDDSGWDSEDDNKLAFKSTKRNADKEPLKPLKLDDDYSSESDTDREFLELSKLETEIKEYEGMSRKPEKLGAAWAWGDTSDSDDFNDNKDDSEENSAEEDEFDRLKFKVLTEEGNRSPILFKRMSSPGPRSSGMRFKLTPSCKLVLQQGDITKWSVDHETDAIVNAANEQMLGGGGVDGAIHRAAGPQLLDACKALEVHGRGVRCAVGEAVETPAFRLPVKRIIHTVGPIYDSTEKEECAQLLANAYRNSMQLAREKGVKYISFPAISCGIYGYPAKEASQIALKTIQENADGFEEVHFVLFEKHVRDAWVQSARDGFEQVDD